MFIFELIHLKICNFFHNFHYLIIFFCYKLCQEFILNFTVLCRSDYFIKGYMRYLYTSYSILYSVIMIFLLTLTIIQYLRMFIFERYESRKINFYIKFPKFYSKALCGSYSWLVVVKSVKRMQN